MSRSFEIDRTVELDASPESVWNAVTTGQGVASWLFPTGGDPEPRVGGSAWGGHVVQVWEPPSHYAVRGEGENGWFNALDYVIEGDGGATTLRYVHSGIFVENWDTQFDAASLHTDFYLHSLGEYLRFFAGRPVAYVAANGAPSSSEPGALERLADALSAGSVGSVAMLDVPGFGEGEGVVDYRTDHFLGIRTSSSLLRFYARGAWGGPLSVGHHLFAENADAEAATTAWQGFLDWLYG